MYQARQFDIALLLKAAKSVLSVARCTVNSSEPAYLPVALDGRHNAHELWLFVANGSSGGFNAIAFAGLGIEANALQNGVGIGIAFDLKESWREDS